MRHVTKYVYVMKCVTMDSGMNCITEVTKMQEMLLDRRTQSLVNDYVPEGEILDELVCFFTIFADYTRLRMISALAISEMWRHRSVPPAAAESDDGLPSAPAAEKPECGDDPPPGESHLLFAAERIAERRSFKGRGISGVLKLPMRAVKK